ncbi:MAG: adenylosuccinate synthase [Alkalispirochaetaceae bacterium]
MKVVVIGAQWGDEGKGKIVDFLASEADVVLRFSGGANAGHTIVHGGKTYKLHLVPSGILYPETTVILGTGMVIDPEALFHELDELKSAGIDWEGRVLISERAHLVLPDYRRKDIEIDKSRRHPIGTTGRGIGVAYSMKSLRDGVRVADVYSTRVLDTLHPEDQDFVIAQADRITDLAVDVTEYMSRLEPETRCLLEGAQGALLDLDLGTYPYVSSGYSAAAGAALGAGIGPRKLDRVLGVFKAYSTRVGNGPFPSEFRDSRDGHLEDYIRTIGNEYGSTTGRPRRCGYLDLVALRYACQANGIDALVLTHLDVYDELDEVKACVAYEVEDETIERFPASVELLEQVQPVTRSFPGWLTPIGRATSFDELPEEARNYIAFIEEFVEVPVEVVSVGQERKETLIRKDPWRKS